MQNFDPSPRETLSAQEAHQVMEAFAAQKRSTGVPDQSSVGALAAGLGVSEEEVRKIVEDIRVQRRSEQIAANILHEQGQHRKKLDVTAAIGAAIAIIVVGLAVTGYFVFGRGGGVAVGGAAPGSAVEVFEATTPTHPVPPRPPTFVHGDMVRSVDEQGQVSYVNGTLVNQVPPDKVGQADQLWQQIEEMKMEERALKDAIRSRTKDGAPASELKDLATELGDIKTRQKDVQAKLDALSNTVVKGDDVFGKDVDVDVDVDVD